MASAKCVTFEEELKKNPELKETDVQMLREWSEKQPHLPKITDREFALFLHSNYYRLEPTKTTIDTYYSIRTHAPEFFANRDILKNPDLKKASTVITDQILEGTTREGYKILFGSCIDPDPSQFVYADAMKFFNMVLDLWLHEEGTSYGYVIVLDMASASLGHVNRLSPMALKKFLYYLQEGLPVRLKGFHFMNASPVIDLVLNMMRPFMKKQLLNIFHMHTTEDSLKKFIPIEVLPNESGGKAGPLRELHDKQVQKLIDASDWFKEEEANCRVDESKRPGKAKTATDLFGVEGSFKKLEID